MVPRVSYLGKYGSEGFVVRRRYRTTRHPSCFTVAVFNISFLAPILMTPSRFHSGRSHGRRARRMVPTPFSSRKDRAFGSPPRVSRRASISVCPGSPTSRSCSSVDVNTPAGFAGPVPFLRSSGSWSPFGYTGPFWRTTAPGRFCPHRTV